MTRTAGSLARQYRRAHSGIDAVDYLIAATALVLDAELLHFNPSWSPDARNVVLRARGNGLPSRRAAASRGR